MSGQCETLLNVTHSISLPYITVRRPPGHRAARNEACGVCFFNYVTLCAKLCINQLGLKRCPLVLLFAHLWLHWKYLKRNQLKRIYSYHCFS